MNEARPTQIEMIPIDRITVANPRARGRKKFRQIVDNIAHLGLKRPITVTRRTAGDDGPQYDLVCGQGRLEAFRALGQTEVPAFVVEASREDLMLMSLAENLARRVRSSPELLSAVAALKDRGYTYAQIAKKTDLDPSYVHGVIRLLNKGEERLLRAVERQDVPLSIAMTIATSDDAEVQRALTEAYSKNALRGKDLLKARRLIELRRVHGKRLHATERRPGNGLSTDALLKEYEKESARQRLLIKQAKVVEAKLLFVVASVRQLLADPDFQTLLREQSLDQLPQFLAEQVLGKRRTA